MAYFNETYRVFFGYFAVFSSESHLLCLLSGFSCMSACIAHLLEFFPEDYPDF